MPARSDSNYFMLIGRQVKEAFRAAVKFDRELTYLNMLINKAEIKTMVTPREFYGVAEPGEQIISISKGGREMKIDYNKDDFKKLADAMGKPDAPFKSKPNWKEAFEQVLAKGCAVAPTPSDCMFCIVANKARLPGNEPCGICPLHWDGLKDCGGPWEELDGSLRRAIFRYVLKTVKDFTDRDEIRARIAEMLDDDAREKFLGKPEPEWLACFVAPAGGGTYSNDGGCGRDDASFPRLTWFVKSCKGASRTINRAGFLTEADARRFLDALPEEEK